MKMGIGSLPIAFAVLHMGFICPASVLTVLSLSA